MFVLMDMEWVENKNGQLHLTQIAAMRVDENWNTEKTFFTRIQPPDESFYLWDRVGYTGGYANEFLSAPPAAEVVKMLQVWLQEKDILCWWRDNTIALFCEKFPQIQQTHISIFPYLCHYLRHAPFLIGSAYHILNQLTIDLPGKQHHAETDTKAMRAALSALQLPQSMLESTEPASEEQLYACACRPYVLDLNTQTVHKRDCAIVSTETAVKEYSTLKNLVGKEIRPCMCCAAEYQEARRRKNQDSIDRSEYAYVYTWGSKVFHRRNCKLILNASNISGAVYYKSCIQSGKMPCRVCNPKRSDETPFLIKAPTYTFSRKKKPSRSLMRPPIVVPPKPVPTPKPKPKNPFGRALPVKQQQAYDRLIQAQAERQKAFQDISLTDQQREDILSLTQPSHAFWTAAGYSSFHLRHCSKLNSLSHFRGFALYEDAVRAGCQPCRQCKPTAKHDMTLSFPIYSQDRGAEPLEKLEECCQKNDFQYTRESSIIQIETSRGIWRVHTNAKPYTLEHINKLYGVNENTDFHVQPRIFLSLEDVLTYIKKHDRTTEAGEPEE